MTQAVKCPNPNCPFLFDPTAVPAGAVLSCPVCQMRFTLGTPAAVSNPPPAAREPAVRSRSSVQRPEQPFPWLPLIGVLVVVGTAVAVGVVVVRKSGMSTPNVTANDRRFPERNVRFRMPPAPWESSDETAAAFGTNLFALVRGGAKVVVNAQDYRTRNPQPTELRESLKSRFSKVFEEYALTDIPNTQWLGRPAVRYQFRGTGKIGLGGQNFTGEAIAVAHQGVGYELIAMAPDAEATALGADLDDILGRFELMNERTGWKETVSAAKMIVGKAADYRLSDGDRWWDVLPDPAIEDAKADLLLEAEFRFKARRDFKPKARLAVLVLPPEGDDPLAVLETYLRGRYKDDLNLTDWQPLTDPVVGDLPTAGEQNGCKVVRFRVGGADRNTAKLVVLSAARMPAQTVQGMKEQVIGVHAVCAFSDQELWENRLVQLAASLRAASP